MYLRSHGVQVTESRSIDTKVWCPKEKREKGSGMGTVLVVC